MDIRSLISSAISLAHMAGTILPGFEGGAQVAEKLLDLLDGLKAHAPDTATKQQLTEAHDALYKRVTDAGHQLSDRLRG